MRRTIGIGVIGMGWMGDAHSRSYRLVGDRFRDRAIDARLVACADVDIGRAEAARDRFGFERATTDWRDVVADPAIEAISVTAPNAAHLEVIRAALGAGKHVLCEKPVGPCGGAQGTLEACRVITGSQCDLAFEVHGTTGALAWSFERMNELRVFRRDDARPADEGWTTELSGPAHPRHASFNPGWGVGLGFDDLKVIEAAEFLTAIATGRSAAPSFEDAAAVARVQQATAASWDSNGWQAVAEPAS